MDGQHDGGNAAPQMDDPMAMLMKGMQELTTLNSRLAGIENKIAGLEVKMALGGASAAAAVGSMKATLTDAVQTVKEQLSAPAMTEYGAWVTAFAVIGIAAAVTTPGASIIVGALGGGVMGAAGCWLERSIREYRAYENARVGTIVSA